MGPHLLLTKPVLEILSAPSAVLAPHSTTVWTFQGYTSSLWVLTLTTLLAELR